MNKCALCQQIYDNLTIINNNSIKSKTRIILKSKGFEVDLNANETLALCEKCKQGMDNVNLFWENIPEAKQTTEKSADVLGNLERTTVKTSSGAESLDGVKQKTSFLTSDQEYGYLETRLEPIKIKIKLPPKSKKKKVHNSAINTSVTSEILQKRISRYPKRYEDFCVTSPVKTPVSTEATSLPRAYDIYNEISFNKLPQVAFIRLKNGQDIGILAEVESKGTTSKIRILCKICYQMFRDQKSFKKHLKIDENIANNYLYHCKLCDKLFNNNFSVRRHFRCAHSDQRPLKCSHCQASFKYKFNLDYHMSKHISKKRFECVFCKKKFLMRYELQIHTRTHTKERPYKCELCPFAFAHKSNLKTHQRIKHCQNFTSLKIFKDSVNKQFKPPEALLEEKNEGSHFSDSILPSTYENFSEDLGHKPFETNFTDTENYSENVVVIEPVKSFDNKVFKISEKNDICNESIKAKPILGTIHVDRSILKYLPIATLLDLKKWPKSFQNTSNIKSLELVKNENLKFFEVNKTTGGSISERKEITDNNSMQVSEQESDSKFSTDTMKSIIKYTPLKTNSNENFFANSQIANYNTIYNTSNMPQLVSVLDTSTNFDIASDDVITYNDKFTNISNLSTTFRAKLDHINFNIPPLQIADITYKTLETNSKSTFEQTAHEEHSLKPWKDIKMSSKTVAVQNVNKSKFSLEHVTDKPLTVLTTIPPNKEIKIVNNNFKQFSNNSHIERRSLLKPVVNNSKISNISIKQPNINQNILARKPVITKVEILPPLKTLPTVQNSSYPINLIKPPRDYKFQCTYCYKYFKQKSSLTKHLRTHTGEKPYKCNLCPKSYADASNYRKHKILHKNAAEALNISRSTAYASPAYSTVSDPDPDGIEVMQTLDKFECSSTDDGDIEDDNVSTSSTLETQMWHDALEHALQNEEIRESIKRNLTGINNAILPKSMQHITNGID